MREKQHYMIELGNDKYADLNKNKEFEENFKISVLLSLLENKKITKNQFEFCKKEIKNKIKSAGLVEES